MPNNDSANEVSEADEAASLAQLATVTPDEASQAALASQPGSVVKVELDNENGNVVYSVEIDTGSGVVDVKVDAGNATVLVSEPDDGDENEADEADEAPSPRPARPPRRPAESSPPRRDGPDRTAVRTIVAWGPFRFAEGQWAHDGGMASTTKRPAPKRQVRRRVYAGMAGVGIVLGAASLTIPDPAAGGSAAATNCPCHRGSLGAERPQLRA